MSGICGILKLDGTAADLRDIERQTTALRHRGPDRSRVWCGGPVGLGHLLMRVTAEDTFDSQPLRDPATGVTLVADLRLDNRETLANELAIAPEDLRDMPDSALLLRAYAKWQAGCVDHLLGDFAFAIWDSRAEKLVVARDHVGQRSLLFHRAPGYFAFATEVKGLWALPDVPSRLEDPLIRDGKPNPPAKATSTLPFESIEALRGGAIMTVGTDGTVSARRYWEPKADPAHLGLDEAYYIDAYRRVLGEAVACRLRRATRPAGLFFSGGFDSGAIAALAGPVLAPQGRKLIAAASVMPADYRGTIRHARYWAELCARFMPHLQMRYITREGRDIFSGMERSFQATDLGHGPSRFVTDELYAAIAAAGARIVMDGHGGDYTLNVRGFAWLTNLLLHGRLRDFASELRAWRRFSGRSVARILREEVLRYLVPDAMLRLRERRNHGLAARGSTKPLIGAYGVRAARLRSSRRVSARTAAGMRLGLLQTLSSLQDGRAVPGALAAAAHGLEFTQPFHDKRVIELALAIPADLWVKDGRDRYLARKVLADLLPPQYQRRGRGNDDLVPDFLAMAKAAEPRILAEIDRMERAGKLAHRFDFPRMRKMLTRRRLDDHNSGSEYDTRQAVLAFIAARYIEWFQRDNQ